MNRQALIGLVPALITIGVLGACGVEAAPSAPGQSDAGNSVPGVGSGADTVKKDPSYWQRKRSCSEVLHQFATPERCAELARVSEGPGFGDGKW